MSAKVTNRESRAFFGQIGEAVPTEDDPQMTRELSIEFSDGKCVWFARWEVELLP